MLRGPPKLRRTAILGVGGTQQPEPLSNPDPAVGRSRLWTGAGQLRRRLGALQGANLVTVHVDGRRTYYSLNTEGIDHFVKAFQAYFHRD